MSEDRVVKKFYRDLTEDEEEYIEDILAEMQDKDIHVPNYLREKMTGDSVVWDDLIKVLDEGVPYEISNEGVIQGKSNPYRIVVAKEFDLPDEQLTVFVKIIPDRNGEKEVVLDVWKKHGPLPAWPPPRTIHQFVHDWDIIPDLEAAQENHHAVPV